MVTLDKDGEPVSTVSILTSSFVNKLSTTTDSSNTGVFEMTGLGVWKIIRICKCIGMKKLYH